jgi:pSer/pThr/pTyr-binding forkhead associated (FHA) protein
VTVPEYELQFPDGERGPLPLNPPICLVGRDPDCDLVIDSPKISRQHALIALSGTRLEVRDLGSTNGIRVQDQPLPRGVVNLGETFQVGHIRLRFSPVPVKMPEFLDADPDDRPSKPAAAGGESLSSLVRNIREELGKPPDRSPASPPPLNNPPGKTKKKTIPPPIPKEDKLDEFDVFLD